MKKYRIRQFLCRPNWHYNEFCCYKECRYKEGSLYTLMTFNYRKWICPLHVHTINLFSGTQSQAVSLYPLKRQSRLQQTTFINTFSLFFRENKTWYFKWGRGFIRKIKPYFRQKIKVKNLNVVCSNFCLALWGLRLIPDTVRICWSSYFIRLQLMISYKGIICNISGRYPVSKEWPKVKLSDLKCLRLIHSHLIQYNNT